MALLGGYIGGLSVGADAMMELEGKKGVFEEGTILALTHAPKPEAGMDKEKAKKIMQVTNTTETHPARHAHHMPGLVAQGYVFNHSDETHGDNLVLHTSHPPRGLTRLVFSRRGRTCRASATR
jgi:hypothetical protein